ncbi:MAG: hypothetical protein IJQ07_03325 [Clostridia bacterium]|nr:hypothetical protein [Clostridia bacterium]
MNKVEFFKQQAKNLLKDYNTRVFNEDEGFYDYSPRFFHDIDDIIMSFDIDEEEPFTLMKAQHIVARLAGFYKWTELIKASEPLLELGELLLTNREAYQEKLGLFTNIVESPIVADWKSYEEENLKGVDDATKLAVFKEVFLDNGRSNRKQKTHITLDFSKDENAQDMLKKIMAEKNLSPEKAILSSITQKNCVTILATGWAGIALSLWGHADPDEIKEKLDNPIIEIQPNKDKERLIRIVMEHEKVAFDTAVLYFMLFTLASLGYHI